jgi:hypothetical protein
MPSYCTVCGVKLTSENKISYRPSSCRDCELERKRLYSLKRRQKKAQQDDEAPKTAKAKETDKKSTTVKAKAKTSSAKKPVEKVKEVIAETVKSVKSATKKPAVEAKAAVKEKEVAKKDTKTKVAETATKAPAKKTTTKKAETATKPAKATKTATETKKVEASAKSAKKPAAKKVEKKKMIDVDTISSVPDSVKSSAKLKVKKRRLNQQKASIVDTKLQKILRSSTSTTVDPEVFGLDRKDLEEEDLLRAPTETPWESASFKVVNGSYIDHGVEDDPESRGPSPEEIKDIIERIRIEHKTRRT